MEYEKVLDISCICDDLGKIYPQCRLKDGTGRLPEGRVVALRGDGQVHIEITYRQGVVHGLFRDFWSNGSLACEGQFHEGQQDGQWHFYWEDGSLMEVVNFRAGKEIRAPRSKE